MNLAEQGKKRIAWADKKMDVLRGLRNDFFRSKKPLEGFRIGACMHVTAETANLMIALQAGGADVSLCASNPLSTQDDIVASLKQDFGIKVFAKNGENIESYNNNLEKVIENEPNIIMDDGADLVSLLHTKYKRMEIVGATEETTTGVVRLQAMEKDGSLRFPVISVNDAKTKHMFDNRYGTGQSTLEGIIRATDTLIAGKTVVVAGYGWCGRGTALKAKGMGANVIVTEIDKTKALEAIMDGFRVMPMEEASKVGDIFITLTGNTDIITSEHFKNMKDGAVVCNSGHFDVEINVKELEEIADKVIEAKENVREYKIGDKSIYLLAEGRLVNLACADGHSADVMDMSFANQALSVAYLTKNKLENKVYNVPNKIDEKVADLKLKSLNIQIDKLSKKQIEYLSSWQHGT